MKTIIIAMALLLMAVPALAGNYILYGDEGSVCIGLKGLLSTGEYPPCYGPVSPEWQIVKTDVDANGDGIADILWKHLPSGWFYAWFIGGGTGNQVIDGAWFEPAPGFTVK